MTGFDSLHPNSVSGIFANACTNINFFTQSKSRISFLFNFYHKILVILEVKAFFLASLLHEKSPTSRENIFHFVSPRFSVRSKQGKVRSNQRLITRRCVTKRHSIIKSKLISQFKKMLIVVHNVPVSVCRPMPSQELNC